MTSIFYKRFKFVPERIYWVSSSVVEQRTVNPLAVGSIPTWPANKKMILVHW